MSKYEDTQVWLDALKRHVEYWRDQAGADIPALDSATVLKLIDHLLETRDALVHTHSRLSLLRHRAGIRWDEPGGMPGIGSAYDCDRILGRADRLLYREAREEA